MPYHPAIVALDVGSSSVRTLLFDHSGQAQKGFGAQLTYEIRTTPDGGVEIDPDMLFGLCADALSKVHRQLRRAGRPVAAIAFDTFWHSFLGIDKTGEPTTPIVHLFDTRSAAEATELARKIDPKKVHARTGCTIHTSYWPSKLLWLARHRKKDFERTTRWISFGEYLFLKLFDKPVVSTSMISGTGLWDQVANHYDKEVLGALPIESTQLADPQEMDHAQTGLTGAWKRKWPLFDGIPWYPALGDGACNNIGSGCTSVDSFALMVGTSGAMRAVVASDRVTIPAGLWCYRVDRQRFVLGGALSNGGDVYAWMRRTLALPDGEEIERALRKARPGAHELEVLPFFSGERSPYWRADLRAAITGMNLATQPMDILQATLEAVSLRFREIYELMISSLGRPKHVIGSGGGLLHSEAWTGMMADALGARVTPCLEKEATSRGAALLASERLGLIRNAGAVPFKHGAARKARHANTRIYETMLSAQRDLYRKLFVEK